VIAHLLTSVYILAVYENGPSDMFSR